MPCSRLSSPTGCGSWAASSSGATSPATTCSPATTPSSTPPALPGTDASTSPARTCLVRARPPTSSTGTAATPTRAALPPRRRVDRGHRGGQRRRRRGARPGRTRGPPAPHRRPLRRARRPCAASAVREVHLIGRRGPEHGKFTTKELRELGELDGVTAVAEADDLPAADPDRERHVAANLAVIEGWVGSPTVPDRPGHPRPLLAAPHRDPRHRPRRGDPTGELAPGRHGRDSRPARPGRGPGRRLPEPAAPRGAVRPRVGGRAQRLDRTSGRRRRARRCPVSTSPDGSSAAPRE